MWGLLGLEPMTTFPDVACYNHWATHLYILLTYVQTVPLGICSHYASKPLEST